MVEDCSPRVSIQQLGDPKESCDTLETDQRGPSNTAAQSGPPRGEPVVKHGHTLTTACGFREVCEAIKESAFVDSDLPIIISLEVHAGWEQQEVMVKIMKEVWQDLLVTEPYEGCDPRFKLPTLLELQRKILIKVKKAESKMEALATHSTTDLPATIGRDEDASLSDNDRPSVPKSPQPEKARSVAVASGASQERSAASKICQNLGDLAVYTRSEHFKGLETKEAKKPAHIFSVSEKRILDIYNKQQREIFLHNKNYFMRAYPDKLRVTSSNLDPSLFWRRGVQMVAMNWQRMDAGMMVNEGMFADEKGWVLKPPGYLSANKSAESHSQAANGSTLDLTITVFAGHNIPTESDDAEEKPRSGSAISPYVRVELHVEKAESVGRDGDINETTFKKRTDAGKTNNPQFNGPKRELKFHGITKVVPELSFVR